MLESADATAHPSPTLEVHPQSQVPGKRGRQPRVPRQFCILHPASYISYIRHLLERVRGPEPGASLGAVVGDAAQVSDRQRRRRGFQADGVAVVQAKWRPRRAAPSALDSVNASRANTLGGGGGERTGWARNAARRAAAVRRQERQPVAGLDCVVMRHRHPFESQPRYCRTRAPRQSTSFLRRWRRWRRCGSGGS